MGYDPVGWRPATVEELAAQERAQLPHRRKPGRRPLAIMLATLALLAGGASAFALARSDSPPQLVQPYGPDAPFGVDYVDGFGEHSPKTTTSPAARKPKSVPPSRPRPSTLDSQGILSSSRMSAIYWTQALDGKYEVIVWVKNESSSAVGWEVRVRLPNNATVTGSTAANRTFGDGTWVFTSTRGTLGGGLVYLFSFSGSTGSAQFTLRSCTINGSPCDPFT